MTHDELQTAGFDLASSLAAVSDDAAMVAAHLDNTIQTQRR